MVALPEPKNILSTKEFIASLDQNNPGIERVREAFFDYSDGSGPIARIYKKDTSLVENIMGSLGPFRLPIIDKALQMVVEAEGGHQYVTGALFCYHHAKNAPPNNDFTIYDSRILGQLYIDRGYGYYFTNAWGRTRDVMISKSYRPDPFDKDLLIELGLDK